MGETHSNANSQGVSLSDRSLVGEGVSIGIRMEPIKMGVARVQIPVLSLEFEQAGLKLADRAAFDDRGNFGDQLRRLWLPMSY